MKKIRINSADKRNAIKRHPVFIREYEEHKKLLQTDKEKAYQKSFEIEKIWGWIPLQSIENAERIDKAKSDCIREVKSIDKEPIRLFGYGEGDTTTEWWIEGERLYLEVDIDDTKTNLKREFERVIDYYQKKLPRNDSRVKEHTLDPWEIYDMQKTDGLTLPQIAAKKSGKTSFDNDQYKAFYASVKRAYNKAEEMIKQVGEEILEK